MNYWFRATHILNADEYYCNSVEYANILNAKKWLNKYRNNCKKIHWNTENACVTRVGKDKISNGC